MLKKTLLMTLLMVCVPSYAQETQPSQRSSLSELFGQKKTKFLPVHQAFGVSAKQEGDLLVVSFRVTPEHYVYQDKLALTLPNGVVAEAWQFDKSPTTIDDPTFGQVAVFEEDVVAKTKLITNADINAPISIKWQGCAKAGLCYPPETLSIPIALNKTTKAPTQSPSKTPSTPPTPSDDLLDEFEAQNQSPVASQTSGQDDEPPSDVLSSPIVQLIPPSQDAQTTNGATSQELGGSLEGQSTAVFPNTLTQSEPSDELGMPPKQSAPIKDTINHTPSHQSSDPFGINQSPMLAVLTLFMLGLLLAFTPCVYPMIPIVVSIVARNKGISPIKGFMLSASYGLGVATAYGILGMIIAWIGQAIGITGWLQNPYVLGGFALLFTILALAMFEVIQIRLPARLSQTLQQKSQLADSRLGSVGGSFLVGLLSALVVSPCVSLPMAGALSAISMSGSVLLGFFALFALGLGLSLPLMLMGAVQGKFMPKAGAWMVFVKEFCALLLLAVALSLVERMWVSAGVLVLWALWFALFGVWAYRLRLLIARAVGFLALAWALCLMAGAGMGNTDAWRPLMMSSAVKQTHNDITVTTLTALDEKLSAHDKVLVDVTASWCVECRIMERTLFSDRPDELSEYQVVKFDITQTTEDSRALLARYGLFGPPALLIYHQGQLKEVLLGEVKRAEFIEALRR